MVTIKIISLEINFNHHHLWKWIWGWKRKIMQLIQKIRFPKKNRFKSLWDPRVPPDSLVVMNSLEINISQKNIHLQLRYNKNIVDNCIFVVEQFESLYFEKMNSLNLWDCIQLEYAYSRHRSRSLHSNWANRNIPPGQSGCTSKNYKIRK